MGYRRYSIILPPFDVVWLGGLLESVVIELPCEEMRLFWGCFWSFWGSDWGPRGHGCAVWAPWTWSRLDEEAHWVWVRI